MSLLRKTRQRLLRKIPRSLRNFGSGHSSVPQRFQTGQQRSERQERQGRWQDGGPRDRDGGSWNPVLAALSRLNDRRCPFPMQAEALQLLLKNRNKINSPKDFSRSINALGRRRYWEESLSLLYEMPKRSLDPCRFSHSAAVSACAAASQWQQAMAVLVDLASAGLEIDLIACSTALSACEKAGRWRHAISLIDEAQKRGIALDIVAMNTAISACGKGQEWSSALWLLSELPAMSLKPTVVTYSSAVTSCERGQQWELALELLHGMRRDANVQPDTIVLGAAVSACEKGRRWEHALHLLGIATPEFNIFPDTVAYNAALSALEKCGEWQRVLAIFADIESGQAAPGMSTVRPDTVTFDVVLAAYRTGLLWAEALELIGRMKAEATNRNENRDGSMQNQNTKIKPSSFSYSNVMCACTQAAKWQEALQLWSEIEEQELIPNVVAYTALMATCGRGQQWESVLHHLDEMQNRDLVPDEPALWVVLLSLVEGAAFSHAIEVYEQAVSRGLLDPWLSDEELDLHGMPVEVAHVAVSSALLQKSVGVAFHQKPLKPLELVVGRGHGSDAGIALISPSVLSMLKEDLNLADCHVHKKNPGRLIVPPTAIEALIS